MHFEYYRESKGLIDASRSSTQGRWRWRLVAGNNETVASGEGYHNKADCLHAIDLLKDTDQFTPTNEVPSPQIKAIAQALMNSPSKE